jgi:hypothetical protein
MLHSCSDKEILEELRPQGVIDVKSHTFLQNGQRVRSGTFFVIFNRPELPEKIKVSWMRLPVSPFIPNPLRCFKCQRFGHHQDKCRRKSVCSNCGSDEHLENCPNEPKCVNCQGPHAANHQNCTTWKQEKEIQKVKILEKVSFQEAREIVKERTTPLPTPGKSYANAASNQNHSEPPQKRETREFGTQTGSKEIGIQTDYHEIMSNIIVIPSTSTQCTTETKTKESSSTVATPSLPSKPDQSPKPPSSQKQNTQQSLKNLPKNNSNKNKKDQSSRKSNEKINHSKASRASIHSANRYESLRTSDSEEMDTTEPSPNHHTSNSTPPGNTGGNQLEEARNCLRDAVEEFEIGRDPLSQSKPIPIDRKKSASSTNI